MPPNHRIIINYHCCDEKHIAFFAFQRNALLVTPFKRSAERGWDVPLVASVSQRRHTTAAC